jgi:hypothetical protein
MRIAFLTSILASTLASTLILSVGPTDASSTHIIDNRGATRRGLQYSVSGVAYVPFRGSLKERKVAFSVLNAQARFAGSRTPLLNEVIRLVPHYFPPHARVLSIRQTGSAKQQYFVVNLNRSFANSSFWKSRKRRACRLAFHSLARNVAFQNEGKGIPLAVRFAIEGKFVPRIGSFGTTRPLEPHKIIKPLE